MNHPKRVYKQSHIPLQKSLFNDVLNKRLSEVAELEALMAASSLKKVLADNDLNIVTAESLTAGMIAKILVDIPGDGRTLYGGFITYDTKSKRQFIDVDTSGDYSILMAQQMAAGALENSQAMVSVAVSGDAMPTPDHKDRLGIVYIGVALRLIDHTLIYGRQVNFCEIPEIQQLCDTWKSLNQNNSGMSYAPFQLTSMVADYIRLKTVAEACNETHALILDSINKQMKWNTNIMS